MEPITTTAMISGIVGYLAKKLKDNKDINDFFKDFTHATVAWIKPLFIEDEKPTAIISKLLEKPDSEPRQNAIKNALEIHLEENPSSEKFAKEMYEFIKSKEAKGDVITIVNSKNVVTGTITAGGSVIIGDNNNSPK